MLENRFIEKIGSMTEEEREELVRKIEQAAHDNEINFYGCSRVTLDALQKHLGLGNEETFKASLPFAGGVARNQEVCGALIGGLMAIGMAFGSDKLDFIFGNNEASKRFHLVTERAQKVCDRFQEEYGTLRCYDIQKRIHGRTWDFKNPKDLEERLKRELHDKCGPVVGTAARLCAQAILEPV